MIHQLNVTDEELEELTMMLNSELTESRVEHRRTDARKFREGLEHRIDVKRSLLKKVECELGVDSSC